ncbi:MAG: hypothetical protein M3N35_00330, partial [Candidatus Binatota bacterium]|nr:hypothetical protein [Candidatus Binatota bacterium]
PKRWPTPRFGFAGRATASGTLVCLPRRLPDKRELPASSRDRARHSDVNRHVPEFRQQILAQCHEPHRYP